MRISDWSSDVCSSDLLAQNCAQGRCERQIDFGVDLSLADARQIVLDWILDREDVGGTGIESPQSRVQRGGLAAAGRASKQENSMRPANQHIQAFQYICSHTQALKLQQIGRAHV